MGQNSSSTANQNTSQNQSNRGSTTANLIGSRYAASSQGTSIIYSSSTPQVLRQGATPRPRPTSTSNLNTTQSSTGSANIQTTKNKGAQPSVPITGLGGPHICPPSTKRTTLKPEIKDSINSLGLQRKPDSLPSTSKTAKVSASSSLSWQQVQDTLGSKPLPKTEPHGYSRLLEDFPKAAIINGHTLELSLASSSNAAYSPDVSSRTSAGKSADKPRVNTTSSQDIPKPAKIRAGRSRSGDVPPRFARIPTTTYNSPSAVNNTSFEHNNSPSNNQNNNMSGRLPNRNFRGRPYDNQNRRGQGNGSLQNPRVIGSSGNLNNARSNENLNMNRGGWNQRFNRGGRYNSNYNPNRNQIDHLNQNFDDNNQNQNTNRRRGGGYFGYKKLIELLENEKNPEDVLMILGNNKEQLLNYLNSNDVSPDTIVLMFEVLSIVINSAFAENVAQLLLAITKNSFFDTVKNFIMQLPIADTAAKNRGRRFWNAYNVFFLNVALTLDALMEVLPSTALDTVPDILKAIIYTLPNMETAHNLTFNDDLKKAFEDLQIKLSQQMDKAEKKKQKRQDNTQEEEDPPPNDFHDIDVYPSPLEISTRQDTYLRRNLIKGAYKDVYTYLDIQYRLLREDFIAPLRDGICEYFEMQKERGRKKLSNIKIFKDVLCLGVVPNVHQIGYLVQAFKPGTIKNLDNSRRFMFGSLICLTPDNFTTIIFGKIIDRDKKFLGAGRLVLGFDAGIELEMNRSYILVECTIYFEPYFHVLTALKRMDERRFPLKEYLVDVVTTSELPGYMGDPEVEAVDNLMENIQDLNDSQIQAFEAALTKKFCIIQGPPGTGKTYLGLKVANQLLETKQQWKTGPMLVICYTNHALDQFLEGLLSTTESLVRVGGQCKNETLQKFNLRNLRLNRVPSEYFERQRNCKYTLERCAREVEHFGGILTMINDGSYVIQFNGFNCEQVDERYANSWFATARRHQILQWLLYQPNNRDDPKFADYEQINFLINQVGNQETAANDNEGKEEEEPEIDPILAQFNANQVNLDDQDVKLIDYSQASQEYLLSVAEMHKGIGQCTNDLRNMAGQGLENTLEYLQKIQTLIKMRIDYDYVCQQLAMINNLETIPRVYFNYNDPNLMPAQDRWFLYALWVSRYKELILKTYQDKDREYRKIYSQFAEVKDMMDLYKLKNVDVIGMTTTGAARMHKVLQGLKCPIVIVEEAAEVLEAHIITALSPDCQHLILIGDHKQLKPSTADYKITKDYKLGVSLFERMVENGLHCHTLNVQHRMRPEIANLVCPSIYPELINHDSVTTYPQVRGVDSPMYFITHNHLEKESADRSKENLHEAEYLIQLARYLALNNYDASRITVIAAYSGQWFIMQRLKKQHHILREMRVCILDNFQGEENDIILLSLVRNNAEGQNGFLNLENRICVALSRAKHGLYVMGNINQLSNASPIWKQISGVFEKYDALGQYLTVRCANHPEIVTQLQDIDDFLKVPEGGCLKICAKPLVCGHTCVKLCHSTGHENYKCYQPCTNIICPYNHVCPDICFKECQPCLVPKRCTLPCGHEMDIPCHKLPEEILCPVLLRNTKLPCGHEADKPCHADVEKFKCPHPCDSRVEPCGHSCHLRCHFKNDPNHETYRCMKQCVKSNKDCCMPKEFRHPCHKLCFEKCEACKIEVRKERACGHQFDVPCYGDVNTLPCGKPCRRKLDCTHNCPNQCDKPCGPCKAKVTKQIPECGHSIKSWECGKIPSKKNCKSPTCLEILACGHKCNLPCAKECTTAKCKQLVPFGMPSPCGHPLEVPCYLRDSTKITNELLSYCTAKCEANLRCQHDCPGTCGQCAQGRFHSGCSDKCSKILICGHECDTPCVQNCKPCTKTCEYKCEHSKCTKKCGAPCTKCTEHCNRKCKHQACTKKCGEMCNVPPCKEPCPAFLKCMHPCIGFCGEPCPPFCRICDEETVTTVFFGSEDDEDARFVYLTCCKNIFESDGLEQWFNMSQANESKEVTLLKCPRCKSNVTSLRYRDQIKTAYKDVEQVKREYFGHPKEIKELTSALRNEIANVPVVSSIGNRVLEFFKDNLKVTRGNQRQDNSKMKLGSMRACLDIFKQLHELRFIDVDKPLTGEGKEYADDYLSFLFAKLMSTEGSINEQQVEEFQMEILRYNRITQLACLLSTRPVSKTMPEYTVCFNKIFNYKKYNGIQDNAVKADLGSLIKKTSSGLAVTDVERRQIVAAIGLGPGHWFKCPNGHFYAIGECGGAMQVANCPECKAPVGGTSHRLIDNNQLAPEMDGAAGPAYPTLNDINMYQI